MALIKAVDDGPPPTTGGDEDAPVAAPEERILVDGTGAIRSATSGALSKLRASASELLTTTVLVSDIMPGWGATAHVAATDLGAIVALLVRCCGAIRGIHAHMQCT